MAEDRHKHKPKSVRIPGGLLAWLGEQAASEGRRPNAVIVAALEEYRANHGGGTAEAGGNTTGNTTNGSNTRTRARGKTTRGSTTKLQQQTPEPAASLSSLPDVPLTIASALPKPQRCSHPGKRLVGGWCPDCDHLIKPGGLWA